MPRRSWGELLASSGRMLLVTLAFASAIALGASLWLVAGLVIYGYGCSLLGNVEALCMVDRLEDENERAQERAKADGGVP